MTPSAAPRRASPRFPLWAVVALPVLVVVLALAGGWMLWPKSAPLPGTPPAAATTSATAPVAAASGAPAAVPSPVPSASPATPAAAEFAITAATEQQILDHVPPPGAPDPTVFRFAANPRILVLDFASLRDQGLMLNRVAALVEKAGLPHDLVLNDSELDAAIRASGDTVETFYYGHDYSAPALVRFFALADLDHIRLTEQEETLRRLLVQVGWFEHDARGGLISIPQAGADGNVTMAARATILHHELSHGEYFTNPAYVAFTHQFWTQMLTAGERDRIRKHLRSIDYDPTQEEVMENEAQAYLMFTYSPEFFTPEMIGMSKARLAELRAEFYQAMPPGWLRDSLGRTLNLGTSAATDRP